MMKTIDIEIDKLKFDNNFRQIDDVAVDNLAASMQSMGLMFPITTYYYDVVDGRHRAAAARQLGLKTIRCNFFYDICMKLDFNISFDMVSTITDKNLSHVINSIFNIGFDEYNRVGDKLNVLKNNQWIEVRCRNVTIAIVKQDMNACYNIQVLPVELTTEDGFLQILTNLVEMDIVRNVTYNGAIMNVGAALAIHALKRKGIDTGPIWNAMEKIVDT